MFLIDDIVLFPFKSLLWVFQKIDRAAHQEMAAEADSITTDLTNLYMMLETGKITEDEFAQGEKKLLDRLDRLEKQADTVEETQETGEEEQQASNCAPED